MNSEWKPVPGHLLTRWGIRVTPENAWPEYPRPQMRREAWLNLNGLWDYGITSSRRNPALKFEGKILVPFAPVAALSGVGRGIQPDERLWYRRTFSIPSEWRGKRILLHFGAVDWETTVWVNGREAGSHRGGYNPFSFDITAHLADGENEIMVNVWDPTDTFWQQHGKQTLKPKGIWYTAVSGIWQTVWLEPVPETYIRGLKVMPGLDTQMVRMEISVEGRREPGEPLIARVFDAGTLVGEGITFPPDEVVTLAIPNPNPWSPDSPHLYDLAVEIKQDKVESYFGMRKFSLEKGRLCLNHAPLFQLGPLDQGYWPDGLYTPPSDEAMRADIELVKSLGFNMLRKHVKVEPARYYHYCDKIGLVVWQDMPNGGVAVGDVASFLTILFGSRKRDHNYRYAGRAKAASRQDYMEELREMVDHLYNFPCIGMWVPFNEGWGQFHAKETAAWLRAYDPTRTVDHASGWFDQGGGDCKSLHVYFKKLPGSQIEQNRATVLSEFGGYSLKIEKHTWNPKEEFGYKKFDSREALTKAYVDLLEKELSPWVKKGLSAAVYTQTTDVETEINGYLTYDREVEKMDFEKIRGVHKKILFGK